MVLECWTSLKCACGLGGFRWVFDRRRLPANSPLLGKNWFTCIFDMLLWLGLPSACCSPPCCFMLVRLFFFDSFDWIMSNREEEEEFVDLTFELEEDEEIEEGFESLRCVEGCFWPADFFDLTIRVGEWDGEFTKLIGFCDWSKWVCNACRGVAGDKSRALLNFSDKSIPPLSLITPNEETNFLVNTLVTSTGLIPFIVSINSLCSLESILNN